MSGVKKKKMSIEYGAKKRVQIQYNRVFQFKKSLHLKQNSLVLQVLWWLLLWRAGWES